jgi:hypothetical protein
VDGSAATCPAAGAVKATPAANASRAAVGRIAGRIKRRPRNISISRFTKDVL